MKKEHMHSIKESRKNLIGFLHFTDQVKLIDLLGSDYSKLSFHDFCDKVIELQQDKKINNKAASEAFEMLAEANTSFRTESHRFESGKIFEYNENAKGHVFLKIGTKKEFNSLNHYID